MKVSVSFNITPRYMPHLNSITGSIYWKYLFNRNQRRQIIFCSYLLYCSTVFSRLHKSDPEGKHPRENRVYIVTRITKLKIRLFARPLCGIKNIKIDYLYTCPYRLGNKPPFIEVKKICYK